MAIDMPDIRKHVIPLLERMYDIEEEVYILHRYSRKEEYLYYHSVAVAVLSAYLGMKMDFSKGEWLQIGIAGLLSDSGMAKIDSDILLKTHGLTDIELNEIKKHPTYSYRLVENIPTITHSVKIAVLQHHERLDGSGYPYGLSKGKIHRYARIIALCDMYHAMTSARLYKASKSPFKVIEALQNIKFIKLDPEVVKAFVDSLASFSIGTKVKLSNQLTGEIVFIDHDDPAKPIVRLPDEQIVSLQQEKSVFIEEIIK
ncbi:HD-GYP domain-containing protein [Virgibacillus oceani]